MRRVAGVLVALGAALSLTAIASAKVLRVGTYRGIKGQFTTLHAVKAARPGDWILIAPGDYKTRRSWIAAPKGHPQFPAGVLITTPDLHIRGMNRASVIVDGTKPGSARCSRAGSAQNFGGRIAGGGRVGGYARIAAAPTGENGLMVYKAPNVSIENLTACNFLGGSADAGNQVWFNGGANTGKLGGHGFYGAYLTTTSTYLKSQTKAGEASATYGIFSSNWSGGTWDHIYASNFNDSGFYIGACRQVCDQTLNHGWAQYNALGYSGTNSGGRLLIENSQFDHNQDGFDTNSQNADEPAPQNGACPHGVAPPVKGAHSCWVFYRNYVHDNNNPNVPTAGSAAAGPVGTGMSVAGGRNDTILDSRFSNNNAWGFISVPYLDSGQPCFGGTFGGPGAMSCVWDDYGNALIGNKFSHNGAYGHPSNGDFAQINLENGHPTGCYSANRGPGGGSVAPASAAALQASHPVCSGALVAAGSSDGKFLSEVLCDSQTELIAGTPAACPSGQYPRVTHIVMHPLPKGLKTMPDVCSGVPANPWCRRRQR